MLIVDRDDNGAGRGRAGPKDGVFTPAPHRFFLPHPHPAPHDRENFLSHPRTLRPLEALPHSVKLYFLLIFPTTITIFSNKMTCFNNKNILEPNKCYKLLSSVHYFFFTSKIELYWKKGLKPKNLQKARIQADSSPPKSKIK